MKSASRRLILVVGFLTFATVASFLWLFTTVEPAHHKFAYIIPSRNSTFKTSKATGGKHPAHMATNADKFTPDVLLAAPRRGPAIPSPDGKLALYTLQSYSFENHKRKKEVRLLEIETAQSSLITADDGASEPHWLETSVLFLRAGDKNKTELVVTSVDSLKNSYVAGTILGPVSDFKLKVLSPGKVAFVCNGKAKKDGNLYNAETEPKKHSSAMIYDELMVRHWDKYVEPEKKNLFYGVIERNGKKGKYRFGGQLSNALGGTNLESPIPPFGDAGHYDISLHGIGFVAKDPRLDASFHNKCNFYYLPISNFSAAAASKPIKVEVSGFDGAASQPAFSPKGKAVAFFQMREDGSESDKNRIILIPDVTKVDAALELLKSDDGKGLWDRSPSTLSWSANGRALYVTAEDQGSTLLFQLPLPADPASIKDLPTPLTKHNSSVSEIHHLTASPSSSTLLLTSTSLIDSSMYTVLDPSRSPPTVRLVSSNTRNGSSLSLNASQVSSLSWTGAHNRTVHALVMKPSGFSEGQTYPLAYLIHGGPQGAYTHSWSTRWNPAVFAEQGYVVVMPNPTGSTGYGQAFTDAIREDWGGAPYEDIAAGFEYIKEKVGYVDTERAVALGASYGGYMMNWIQGHELGRKFRALVCHDGVFSQLSQLSSDEQFFAVHDFGGPYWDLAARKRSWERWDPARFVQEWKTPMLVIHSDLDYRLPISEGLSAFNVLQGRGIQSRMLVFPDENHWVLKEENSLVWHREVIAWINKFVGLPEWKVPGEDKEKEDKEKKKSKDEEKRKKEDEEKVKENEDEERGANGARKVDVAERPKERANE